MISQTKYDYNEDLEIVNSMVERLESYLYSDSIYGNQGLFIEGLPAITIGGLLMRIRRLNALRELIGLARQHQLDKVIAKHDAIYNKWQVHYKKKLQAELESRIGRIQQFIDEIKENQQSVIIFFKPEQMRRTIVQEILYMMQRSGIEIEGLGNTLKAIDYELRQVVKQCDFIWAPLLSSVYSSDEFWWLYSELNQGK
ncbi:MAG: hypothetical protein Phog2KO_41860 [Phototrophicaceae bacterium]